MIKRVSANNLLTYLIIALLMTAVAIRGGAAFNWMKSDEKSVFSMSDIAKAFPGAAQYSHNNDHSLSVTDKKGQLLGYVLVSEELDARYQGFGGYVPILIALNDNQQIKEVMLLNNAETPDYISHLKNKKLLERWNGLSLDTSLISLQVDAVTGATFSSNAIIHTFRQTTANYLQMQNQQISFNAMTIVEVLLLGILLYMSLNMVLGKRFRKYYWYYLTGVLLVMGLWLKKMLSLEQMHHWLVKGFPWQSNWELLTILLLSLAMAVAGHRKYYCNYLCPMGALQMLVSKISPFKKRTLSIKISVVTLRTIYLSFIWTSLLLGFSLSLADMEPFTMFSFKVASWVMLSAGILIVIVSLFINRPWCQFCPTGCLLDTIQPVFNKTNSSKYEA